MLTNIKQDLIKLRDELYFYSLVHLSKQQIAEYELIETAINLMFTLVEEKHVYLSKYDRALVMTDEDATEIYNAIINYLKYLSKDNHFISNDTGINHYLTA